MAQRRVTVNLAPPTVRKVGPGLDLAIAVAMLVASGQVTQEAVGDRSFLGELGLDGTVRPVAGTLCLTDALGTGALVLPVPSAVEAGLVGDRILHPVRTLGEVVACLRDEEPWPRPGPVAAATPPPPGPDLADVRGQPVARFALEVAAAGGHHLLLLGPPGAGKTMLAARLPGVLPPLSDGEALETTRVHSAAGLALPKGGLIRHPPFRAPHHGASAVALVGGGTALLRPGEISSATNGVLFLDELAEFTPRVLDALRQPLEEGVVRVARAVASVSLPARFLLVAAMNPCPCGYGSRPGGCRCSEAARARYARRLSGPLLDRFDLRVEVTRPSVEDLLGNESGEPSRVVASRVAEVARSGAPARRAHERGAPRSATRRGRSAVGGCQAAPHRCAPLGPALRPGAPPRAPRGPHHRGPERGTARDRPRPRGHRAGSAGRHLPRPACRSGAGRMIASIETGCAALLAGLPGMGPKRLTELLDAERPEAAWARVCSGRGPRPQAAAWAAAAAGADPAAEAERYADAGVAVLLRDDPDYPSALAADIEPPAVLFAQGDLARLDGPRVAIVGTRRCTGTGAGFARELGRELAGAGVVVVSGLALGIDGAAHRGVLDGGGPGWAPPIGVVGSGHDVPYPARHRALWQEVVERGRPAR